MSIAEIRQSTAATVGLTQLSDVGPSSSGLDLPRAINSCQFPPVPAQSTTGHGSGEAVSGTGSGAMDAVGLIEIVAGSCGRLDPASSLLGRHAVTLSRS